MAKAYEIGSDNLVLDGQNIDVKNIEVFVPSDAAGKVARGQVIDRHKADGTTTYVTHAVAGEANVIAAQDVEYTSETSKVVVPCYVTGEFRADAVIATPALVADDVEAMRVAGIILA